MKLSINSLSPLAKFLIGMALVLVSVFLEVSSVSKYQFVQGVLMGGGVSASVICSNCFFQKS